MIVVAKDFKLWIFYNGRTKELGFIYQKNFLFKLLIEGKLLVFYKHTLKYCRYSVVLLNTLSLENKKDKKKYANKSAAQKMHLQLISNWKLFYESYSNLFVSA